MEKCRVDYFDFYLLHNLCETSYGLYTDETLGMVEYLLSQKRAGRIRHLGFSAHGRAETIDKFLNRFDCFEFAQIQINYLDWVLQDAGKKYEVIAKRGMPVIAMEPVRGGRLAKLPPTRKKRLKRPRPAAPSRRGRSATSRHSPTWRWCAERHDHHRTARRQSRHLCGARPAYRARTGDPRRHREGHARRGSLHRLPLLRGGVPPEPGYPQAHLHVQRDEVRKIQYHPVHLDAMSEAEKPGACLKCGACCARICPQGIDIRASWRSLRGCCRRTEERRGAAPDPPKGGALENPLLVRK
jgi:hypothetical protein